KHGKGPSGYGHDFLLSWRCEARVTWGATPMPSHHVPAPRKTLCTVPVYPDTPIGVSRQAAEALGSRSLLLSARAAPPHPALSPDGGERSITPLPQEGEGRVRVDVLWRIIAVTTPLHSTAEQRNDPGPAPTPSRARTPALRAGRSPSPCPSAPAPRTACSPAPTASRPRAP